MKYGYISKKFHKATLEKIELCNQIISDYQLQGYDLTLRQLYYQLVSRDYIPNNKKEYDRLVGIVSNARLAGLMDWSAIVDRTRAVQSNSHWDSPQSILRSAQLGFKLDHWKGQEYRPEVWIEKDALRGVISGVCNRFDVPHFSCRGYTSLSEMWSATQRMIRHQKNGQTPYIIHLGDHDPSGIDMTRDIIDRLETFQLGAEGTDFHVKRIALNYDQVLIYNPPPNFAKMIDSRAAGYVEEFGTDSWELDALTPETITTMIESVIESIRDEGLYQNMLAEEQGHIDTLESIRLNYGAIVEFLGE